MKFLPIYIISLVVYYLSFNCCVDCHLNLRNKCSQNCQVCENGLCLKCNRGLYSYTNQCYESCPNNLVADNISFTCLEKSKNPLYAKAFTVSRCMNSCGKVFTDCSCHLNCEKLGNCCTDYKICEIIAKNHSTLCLTNNCKLCTKDRKTCLQCKDNFNYFNGNCVVDCPKNSFKSNQNICLQRNEDCDEQCEKCESGKCANCHVGFYLFQGKCLRNCPVGYRANRINFTCLLSKEFSFYWIYPSRQSCDQKCGDNTNTDCSCKYTCLRRGNCCDNFEKLCPEEITKEKCGELCDDCTFGICKKCKPNSQFNKSYECECLSNYQYNQNEDICENKLNNKDEKEGLSSSIIFLSKKDKELKTMEIADIKKPSEKKSPLSLKFNPNKEVDLKFTTNNKQNLPTKRMIPNYTEVSNSLRSHLKDTMNRILELIKSKGTIPKNNMSIYLNGNINLNLMNNNVRSNLLNKRLYTTNSNNKNNQRTENLNSFNSLSSMKREGNVAKHINSGTIGIGNQLNASMRPSRKRIDIKKNFKIDHEKSYGADVNNILDSKENIDSLGKERNKYINPNSKIGQYLFDENSINRPIQHYHSEALQNDNTTIIVANLTNATNSTVIENNSTIPDNLGNNININQTNESHDVQANQSIPQNITGNHSALIIGHENEVKGNRLFHNVINVHNSYILSAKSLEHLKNLTNFHNSTGNHTDNHHRTLIIVNANK